MESIEKLDQLRSCAITIMEETDSIEQFVKMLLGGITLEVASGITGLSVSKLSRFQSGSSSLKTEDLLRAFIELSANS
jgi:hypothetical protein